MRKMKDSGIDWIGAIPEDWIIKKIKYIGKARNGLTYSPQDICDEKDGTLVLRSSNIQNGKISLNDNVYVNGDIPDELMVKDGDILICSRNGSRDLVGKNAMISEINASFGAFMMVLRCDNSKYVYYILNSPIFNYYLGAFFTTTINQLTATNFNNMQFVYTPNTDEQKKITDFLDKKCSQIDSIIEKQHQVIEKLNAYKLSVITEAVTKGLNPDVPMKYSGIEWIGDIPEYATVTRVGHLYKSILGKMLSSIPNSDEDTLEDYFCAINIHFDGIDYENVKQMWFSTKEKEIYLVKKGDLLVVEGGAGAGGASVVDRDVDNYYVQNSIHIVRPTTKKVNTKFLYYTLYSLVKRNYIDFVCNKATIPHFTKDKLLNVPVVVLEDVDAITDYLDKKCAAIDKSIEKRRQLTEKLTEYKKSLIFEVVTGKKEV